MSEPNNEKEYVKYENGDIVTVGKKMSEKKGKKMASISLNTMKENFSLMFIMNKKKIITTSIALVLLLFGVFTFFYYFGTSGDTDLEDVMSNIEEPTQTTLDFVGDTTEAPTESVTDVDISEFHPIKTPLQISEKISDEMFRLNNYENGLIATFNDNKIVRVTLLNELHSAFDEKKLLLEMLYENQKSFENEVFSTSFEINEERILASLQKTTKVIELFDKYAKNSIIQDTIKSYNESDTKFEITYNELVKKILDAIGVPYTETEFDITFEISDIK